ncbi:MAG: DUF1707 domain-containing protein [Solirubrobacterales bacterium]|nr:DUF1707 domain-containing protein [Solirubrobacterales bacterium]
MPSRGTLRASDAEREQIVERLRKAAAEGRLAAHELEQRVASALKARTYGELDATVSDLPGGRLARRRSAPHWTISAVRAHPVLLLAAIPVVLVAVAAVMALVVLWTVVTLAVCLLGMRCRPYRGPWTYARRRGYIQPRSAAGRPGYWL